MKRKTLKKALSAFLSLLMCMMTLLSISTPVFAATTVDAYMVDFPRDGDSNYSATAWGHSATSLMGGWRFLNSKYTTVHSIGTYNGQVSYCIEPGIGCTSVKHRLHFCMLARSHGKAAGVRSGG